MTTDMQLKALPENETFGMTPAQASDWAKTVERRFELWARSAQECDIQGLRTFGQMQAAAFRSWLITGEILAELPWRKRPWNRYGTKVRLLPPQRLSRKTESMRRLINGVYTDADGMPVGYRAIRKDLFKHDVEYDLRAPIVWSGLIVSASWAFGPLERYFLVLVADSPRRCAA